jgi:hypothetical protein
MRRPGPCAHRARPCCLLPDGQRKRLTRGKRLCPRRRFIRPNRHPGLFGTRRPVVIAGCVLRIDRLSELFETLGEMLKGKGKVLLAGHRFFSVLCCAPLRLRYRSTREPTMLVPVKSWQS